MKAAVFKGLEEKIKIIEDYPRPVPDKDEILIKVKFCGICGTDVSSYFYQLGNVPIIMGHEFSGIIESIGKNVKNFQVGDAVSAWTDKEYFGNVEDGGFAEYIKVKESYVVKKPNEITFEEICLAEPVSCLIHARDISGIGKNEGVIILGSGVMGISLLQVLLATREPKYVIMVDFNQSLLDKAMELGASACFKPKQKVKIRKFIREHGACSFVFDCAGAESSYLLSLELVEKGGTVLLEGIKRGNIPIPVFMIVYNEIVVKGSYCQTRKDFLEAIELIKNKKINTQKMISDIIPLEKVQEGIERMKKSDRTEIKILVKIS